VTRAAFWETVTRFETAKVTPWLALRNALGVALPLAIGAAIGNAGGGLIMSTGALNVSFSDGSDPYAHRARRMLLASLFCGVAVFVGGFTGHLHALAILGAGGCAFAAGMMVAVSQTAADIGTVTMITFVVFSAQEMSPKRAIVSGLLALAGGLLQMSFALALWPVRRYTPERRALASLYSELAHAESAGAPATEAPPASAQINSTQAALQTLSGDRSLEAERYLALLSQAERIRLGLLMLSRLRVRIGREPDVAAEAERLSRAMSLAAEMLAAIGEALASGRPSDGHAACVAELRDLGEQLRARDSAPMIHDARAQIEALSGQLRAALDLAGHTTPHGARDFEKREAGQPWSLRLGGVLAILRANLQLNSAAFRHAVRLAVCVVLGTIGGHALNWRHSYWLPMTIAIVLKPDFTATFSRGLLRLGGTVAGLVLATGLFHFLSPGLAAKVGMIAVCAFLLRCFGPANYGVFVTALTALVVLMFAVTGVAPAQVIVERGLNTAAGGLIALAAYWLWPTWERTQVSEILATMLESYRLYFRAVASAYLEPEKWFAARLDGARLAARLGRSNLEASAMRLRAEPGVPASRLTALDTILANSHRFIHAVMSLEAGLVQSRPVPARDSFRVFTSHVDLTLYYLAAALRGSSIAAADLPDLREDHHTLEHSGDAGVERYALVNVETDRIVNSLNTLADEIFAWARTS
jgi:uncharacterized membrane protein YccC